MKILRLLGETVAVAGAYFLALLPLRDQLTFSIYQIRDLDRALRVNQGLPIFFGPESSGGGHLPGSLYYYLIALPLSAGLGWPGVWELLVTLTALSFAALWIFARRRLSSSEAILLLIGFLTSLSVVRALLEFNNSSFVYPFVALGLIGLIAAFQCESNWHRGMGWLSCTFFTGLGMQIHLPVGSILLIGLFLQIFAQRLGMTRLSAKIFLGGLLVILLTLAPYLTWSYAEQTGHPYGQQPLEYTGGEPNGPSSLQRQLSRQLEHSVRDESHFQEAVQELGAVISLHLLPDLAQTLALLAFLGAWFWRDRRPREPWIWILALYWILAFVVPFPLIMANNFARYVNGAALAFVFVLPLGYRAFATTKRRKIRAGAILFVTLFASIAWNLNLITLAVLGTTAALAVPILMVAVSDRSLFSSSPWTWIWIALVPLYIGLRLAELPDRLASQKKPTAKEYELLSNYVHAKTGWDYITASRRIYYVNVNNQLSPRHIYEHLFPQPNAELPSAPDGYFFAYHFPEEHIENTVVWLLSQEIEGSIARGLQSGAIELGPIEPISPRFVIIPYKVGKALEYPRHFSNHGDTYQTTHAAWIDEHMQQAQSEPHREVAALFNDCPGGSLYCRILLTAESKDLRKPENVITVHAFGYPIGFQLEWVSPDWTEALLRPFVRFYCADQIVTTELAESIGYQKKRGRWILNHSLIAPFERQIRPRCRGPISKIELGYKSARATSMFKRTRLDGATRVIDL